MEVGKAHFEGMPLHTEKERAAITIGVLLDRLKARWQRQAIKGMTQALGHLEKIRDDFGGLPAVSLRPFMVSDYIDRQLRAEKCEDGTKREALAPATINRRLEILRAALRQGVKDDLLPKAIEIEMLPENNVRQGFVEPEQFVGIMNALGDGPVADFFAFSYWTGWRRGELLGLEWECVDRKRREIRLATSKNGMPRSLSLNETLWTIIERRWQARRFRSGSEIVLSPYVFHVSGRKIPSTTLWKKLAAAFKAAGCPGMRLHDCRRTAARDMLNAGVQQSVAQMITGHESPSMFRRYALDPEKAKRDALDQRVGHVVPMFQKFQTSGGQG